MRGGIKYLKPVFDPENGVTIMKHRTTRAIKSIDKQVLVNKALWNLAENYAS